MALRKTATLNENMQSRLRQSRISSLSFDRRDINNSDSTSKDALNKITVNVKNAVSDDDSDDNSDFFRHSSNLSAVKQSSLRVTLSSDRLSSLDALPLNTEPIVVAELEYDFSFEELVYTGFKFLLLVLLGEYALIQFFGVSIQESSEELTHYFQRLFDSELAEEFSELIHHSVTSHGWLLACASFYWVADPRIGAKVFSLAALSYVLKSLFKNLFRSPRVFWVSSEIFCFYCGKGFSLPSGHAMMSAVVLASFAYYVQEPWVYTFSIMFEVITFVNVIYIGTHSFADVVVGWTCAGCVVLFFILLDSRIMKKWPDSEPSKKIQVVFFTIIFCFFLFLDGLDTLFSSPEFPVDWQRNMGRACRMDPDDAPQKMYLRLEFSSTPLVLGVITGYLLRNLITKNHQGLTFLPRMFTFLLGGIIYLRSSRWVRMLLTYYGYADYFHHFHNFFLPVWVLFLAPSIIILGDYLWSSLFGVLLEDSTTTDRIRRLREAERKEKRKII